MKKSITEELNPNTKNIDELSTFNIIKLINDEDKKVAIAVENCLPEISNAVDMISKNFLRGGRLLYFGAGTSGRLGILDASECPPTFSVDPEMVIGTIAGGQSAIRHAIEGAEDSEELANEDFKNLAITSKDTVTCISANGNAKYIIQILKLAKGSGINTIVITSNKYAKSKEVADIFICANTGPEVISGSTRMKAGTAQKMILNMLTTSAMIKLGKVYENLMIDVNPTNSKLKQRATAIVAHIAQTTETLALQTLEENGFKIKEAVLKLKFNLPFEKAQELLKKNNGILKDSFKSI